MTANLITNLLDKDVLFEGKECKICAVYQYNENIMLCVMDSEGRIEDGVRPNRVKLNNPCKYTVVLYWHPVRKINAIKTVREVNGMSLREAKDLVEGNPNGVKIKTKLTKTEAEEVMRILEANGMEGQIVLW
jgi:ribosomal protein L7/L12